MTAVSTRFTPGYRLFDGSQLNQLVAQINMGLNGSPFFGPTYFVDESTGSDTRHDGSAPTAAFATIDKALAVESAATAGAGNRNAVVFFQGTQHRTSSLAWNLPQTHLIGLDAPMRRGKRARISVTGSTAYDKLVNVSAAGCLFSNFGTFYGFNSSTASICWYDSAGRNAYLNVEFMGFGDGTASTGTANHTAARALTLTGSTGETTFDSCVFGVDTVTRNATNYTVEIAGGSPRNYFVNCDFEAYLGSSGTGSSHVLVGAAGIDRYLKFIGCRFNASGNSGASSMAQAFNVNTAAGGTVMLDQCTAGPGVTAWMTTPVAAVVMNMVASTTTGGISHVVF